MIRDPWWLYALLIAGALLALSSAGLEAERDQLKEELVDLPEAPTIELHPHAVQQYKVTVENLAERLNDLDSHTDAEAFNAFRARSSTT